MAGTTASRNRFGQYLRSRAVPVQPRTPKQTFNRAILAAGSSRWRTLSAAVQNAWNDYAAGFLWADSLGSSYSPTGAEMFTGCTVATNGAVLTDPPEAMPLFTLAIDSVTYVDATPGPEALNVSILSTSTESFMTVETSGPLSPGITSAASIRRWRSLTAAGSPFPHQYALSADPVDIITNYKALFPSPAVGQAIWFRFSEVTYPAPGNAGVTNKVKQTFRLVVT